MDIATTPAPSNRRTWPWITLAGVLAALALGVGAYYAFGRSSGPTLTAAEKSCNDGRTDARVSDGGKTLIITTSPDAIKKIIDVQTVDCVLDYLKTPASVTSRPPGRSTAGRPTRGTDSPGRGRTTRTTGLTSPSKRSSPDTTKAPHLARKSEVGLRVHWAGVEPATSGQGGLRVATR